MMGSNTVVKFYPTVEMAVHEFCRFRQINEGHVLKSDLRTCKVMMLDASRYYFHPLRKIEDCYRFTGVQIHVLDFHPDIVDPNLIHYMRTRLRGMRKEVYEGT